ncbi:MAG: thiolase family protein [Candidatus Obscuribacterales bacterium]|nr:thiolase family protein [Candidatus Obscuribacterales bacterium]
MTAQRHRAWLLNGVRTAIGSFKKTLRSVPVEKLAEEAIAACVRRSGVSTEMIDGLVLGHGYQSSYAPNTARCAALAAGLPASIPAMTVQRQCGSGMEAVNIAMKDVFLANADLFIAGGAESMSGVPYLIPANLRYRGPLSKYFPFGPRPVLGKLADDGLVPTQLLWDTKTTHMAATAQRLADTYGISRKDADAFSLRSQEAAARARREGRFEREIEAVSVKGRGIFERDEHIRENTSAEKLASLPGVLKTRDITAGNSSGINDGACALLIASDNGLKNFSYEPLAELVDSIVVGVDPEQMGLGPVFAIAALLERNKLGLKDIDLLEINEAFAAQYLACEKLLGLDREKVNVNGGAIALGHPIGMSGSRLILTLAHELKARGLRRGIASLCVGGGMGIATLLEVHK